MCPVQWCRVPKHCVNNEYKLQLVSPIIFILLSAKEYHALICLRQLPHSRSRESRGQPRMELTAPGSSLSSVWAETPGFHWGLVVFGSHFCSFVVGGLEVVMFVL